MRNSMNEWNSAATTKATDHALQKYDNFTRYGQHSGGEQPFRGRRVPDQAGRNSAVKRRPTAQRLRSFDQFGGGGVHAREQSLERAALFRSLAGKLPGERRELARERHLMPYTEEVTSALRYSSLLATQ